MRFENEARRLFGPGVLNAPIQLEADSATTEAVFSCAVAPDFFGATLLRLALTGAFLGSFCYA